jgi:hypothetical protein
VTFGYVALVLLGKDGESAVVQAEHPLPDRVFSGGTGHPSAKVRRLPVGFAAAEELPLFRISVGLVEDPRKTLTSRKMRREMAPPVPTSGS